VLNAMGNPGSDKRLQGLVFPVDKDSWFMTVRFESAGYVKDDDAKDGTRMTCSRVIAKAPRRRTKSARLWACPS